MRETEEFNDEYSKYFNSAERIVPETTFNNMHGRLCHLNSVDGKTWNSILEERSNQNNSNRSRKKNEKVDFMLNVSGWWTKEDVWGTSGWEVRSNIAGTLDSYGKSKLSWKKYEAPAKSYNTFLQHLSQLTWPEQSKFKEVFDKYLQTHTRKNPVHVCEDNSKKAGLSRSPFTEASRKAYLPQSIGLKQLGRSIKYMTLAEKREEQKKKGEIFNTITVITIYIYIL